MSTNTTSLPPSDVVLAIPSDSSSSACELAGRWFALTLVADDTPSKLTAEYIGSLLPPQFGNGSQYPPSQLVDWWTRTLSPAQHDASILFANTTCSSSVCKNELGFEGDPDIAGVGMMISYTLAAILATVYFLAILANHILTSERKVARYKQRVNLTGFLESLNSFVDASLLMALAMIGAWIVRASSLFRHPEDPFLPYEMIGSFLMTLFSILHAVMLQSLSDSLEKRKFRLWVWSLIVVLAALMLAVVGYADTHDASVFVPRAKSEEHKGIAYFNFVCDAEGYRINLQKTSWATIAVLGVNFFVWLSYLAATLSTKFDGWLVRTTNHRWGWLVRLKFVTQMVNATACGVVMWWILAVFYEYRNHVIDRTGEANFDTAWSFGQVLALATWAAVVFDLANVYIYGTEAGLANKLSERYKVVRADTFVTDYPQYSLDAVHHPYHQQVSGGSTSMGPSPAPTCRYEAKADGQQGGQQWHAEVQPPYQLPQQQQYVQQPQYQQPPEEIQQTWASGRSGPYPGGSYQGAGPYA